MRSGRASFEVAVANGVLAGYRLDGEPPALILHGGPGLDHTYMDGFVDELEDIVAAISYQQRGLPPARSAVPTRCAVMWMTPSGCSMASASGERG